MLNSSYYPDDIVTIAEARERLAETSPTRDAFHKAIKRGKLNKLPDQADGAVRLLWGDVLDYMDQRGSTRMGKGGKSAAGVDAPHELDEEASPVTTGLINLIMTPAVPFTEQASADAVAVEVLPKEEKSESGKSSELEEVEKLLVELPLFADKDYIKHFKVHSNRAVVLAKKAVAEGTNALLHAWACGTILNTAKAKCSHCEFTPWLSEHISIMGISIRTCQRYMKLAKKCRLRDLLESQPGLKDAYVAYGILQEPAKPLEEAEKSGSGDTAQGSDHPTLAKPLMSCAATFQKRLRDFAASGESLTTGDIDKLGEVMNELSRFYGQLQEQTNEMNQTAAA